MLRDNRIYWGKNGNGIWTPKIFLSEVKQGVTPMTIWKLYSDKDLIVLDALRTICRTITAERVKRVGGTFRFYRLGAMIFDDTGALNPDVTFQDLAAYIWSKFTKTLYTPNAEPPLIFVAAYRISAETLKSYDVTFQHIPTDIC